MRAFLLAFALMVVIIGLGTLVANLRYQRRQSAANRALTELWKRKERERRDDEVIIVPEGVNVVTLSPEWQPELSGEPCPQDEPTVTLERKPRAISFEE